MVAAIQRDEAPTDDSRLTAPRGLACGSTLALWFGSCIGVILGEAAVVFVARVGVEAAEEEAGEADMVVVNVQG